MGVPAHFDSVCPCAHGRAGRRAQESAWLRRVLITNDNGIEDVPTQELARAFARIVDVVLVASSEDRSGASNLMTFTRTGREAPEDEHAAGGLYRCR
jgi:hypothetical protein